MQFHKVVACDGCQVVRSGTVTEHGVITSGFPVAVSGGPRMRCQTHKRSFHVLHPLVHEALPADTLGQRELVVLMDDVVLLKDACLTLGAQVGSSCSMHASSAALILRFMYACSSQSPTAVAHPQALDAARFVEVAAMNARWCASVFETYIQQWSQWAGSALPAAQHAALTQSLIGGLHQQRMACG